MQSPKVGCPGCFVHEPQKPRGGKSKKQGVETAWLTLKGGGRGEGGTGQRTGTQHGFSLRAIGNLEGF